MLSVQFIKENIESVKESLRKRNVQDHSLIDNIIQKDDQRKSLKSQLDDILSQSNRISKEIGLLFKNGQIAEANEKKQQTAEMKVQSANLKSQLSQTETELVELQLQMPIVLIQLFHLGSRMKITRFLSHAKHPCHHF